MSRGIERDRDKRSVKGRERLSDEGQRDTKRGHKNREAKPLLFLLLG